MTETVVQVWEGDGKPLPPTRSELLWPPEPKEPPSTLIPSGLGPNPVEMIVHLCLPKDGVGRWTINHGLGYCPNVSVIADNAPRVSFTVVHMGADTMVISSDKPCTGTAYLMKS